MQQIIILFIASFISLVILYFIIRGAVASALKPMHRDLRIMLNMKADELKKDGMAEEEIKSIVNRVNIH